MHMQFDISKHKGLHVHTVWPCALVFLLCATGLRNIIYSNISIMSTFPSIDFTEEFLFSPFSIKLAVQAAELLPHFTHIISTLKVTYLISIN